jgi:predicted acetyltransferase
MALPDLVQVDCDDARLGRLLQLYIHEWSAKLPVPIGADALFAYPGLAAYRDRASHRAFLFVDQVPLGFALVVRDEAGAWEVEEFFVVAGARRRGLGAAAARRVFAEFPGPWTFTVRPENPEGLAFWRRTLGSAQERVEVGGDGVARTRFSFVAGGNP